MFPSNKSSEEGVMIDHSKSDFTFSGHASQEEPKNNGLPRFAEPNWIVNMRARPNSTQRPGPCSAYPY